MIDWFDGLPRMVVVAHFVAPSVAHQSWQDHATPGLTNR
jgi:hypothetical protein